MDYLKIERSQEGLYEKFTQLKNKDLDWYEQETIKIIGIKNLPSKSDDDLIRQIIGKSLSDHQKKINGREYYIANAVVFLSVFREILSDDFIQKFAPQNALDDLLVYNYYRLFHSALFDSLILLNEYCANIKKSNDLPFGCGKNHYQHTLTLYQSLRQSIYGQCSYHSFIEVEPDLSISIIRQLVEIRVRRAFGVLGYYDVITGAIEPLSMSVIFKVLKEFKSRIDFSIPFDCLIRVYGWSNIFLHTGLKEYSWKHIFITNYLKEFSLGKPPNATGWSVNSGISIESKQVLDDIHSKLKNEHPKDVEVITCKPEAKIINA